MLVPYCLGRTAPNSFNLNTTNQSLSGRETYHVCLCEVW